MHVQHVNQDISEKVQQNVQLVHQKLIVQPVQQQQTNVLHVNQDIIQMDQYVHYVQQLLDVRHVHKQQKYVQPVQVDIICHQEHVLNVQVK